MERFEEEREKALQNLRVADHMLHVTYPLLHDPKLLLGVMDNIFLAMAHTMGAILHYDRFFKRIPPFYDNFESKFNLFKLRCMPHYRIDKKVAETMLVIKDIISLHRKSPVEFRKNDQYVICHPDYSITVISTSQIKEHIQQTKEFASLMDVIVSHHERLPGGSERGIEAS